MTEFKLKILTPEGVVYDGMAESVIVRTTVGDKGILAKHEPYVAALTIGQAKIRIDGAVRIGAVSSGIVEVTRRGTLWASSSFLSFQAYIGVAVVYLILTLTLSRLVAYIERRLAQSDRS